MEIDFRQLNVIINQISEERNIPKDTIIETLKEALASAYKRSENLKGHRVKVDFDEKTGIKRIYEEKVVIDSLQTEGKKMNPKKEITLEDARKIKSEAKVGDILEFDLPMKTDFGRIAAQTAKQVIIQKIKEVEKNVIYDEFKNKQGEIISGIVERVERGVVFLEVGKAIGIILPQERIPNENYKTGQRLRAFVKLVKKEAKGTVILLSRSSSDFLRKLFEVEIPEIAQKAVEIKAIAREPGSRSKVAVYSLDPKIDPIGSCVGQKGTRISTIINELNGENIDIIKWDENPQKFIQYALSPAKIIEVEVNQDSKSARAKVTPDQFSLAVGKDGQNVRLAAKLTGYKIDIEEIKS